MDPPLPRAWVHARAGPVGAAAGTCGQDPPLASTRGFQLPQQRRVELDVDLRPAGRGVVDGQFSGLLGDAIAFLWPAPVNKSACGSGPC